ncbi:MAG: DUF1643 domain-containing protein [SAR324 cluster bacterium]|nr:DUF1643 domain-containing protein [SAR324 cluster bacterium]
MERDAIFDATGAYRYALTRRWRSSGRQVAFVLLNPSTADAERDDHTIRRCIGFARAWGFAALEVVNLFAYRATTPVLLKKAAQPIGEDNDRYLLAAQARAGRLVVAWGIHGPWLGRERVVLGLLSQPGGRLSCLGLTKHGHPRHPLFLPAGLRTRPFPTQRA